MFQVHDVRVNLAYKNEQYFMYDNSKFNSSIIQTEMFDLVFLVRKSTVSYHYHMVFSESFFE